MAQDKTNLSDICCDKTKKWYQIERKSIKVVFIKLLKSSKIRQTFGLTSSKLLSDREKICHTFPSIYSLCLKVAAIFQDGRQLKDTYEHT